jgi:hypothetical protein
MGPLDDNHAMNTPIPIAPFSVPTLATFSMYSSIGSAMKKGIILGHGVTKWACCLRYHYWICAPAVFALLLSCSPSDVAKDIALVIVDSVKRMAGCWRVTDFFVKCFKGCREFLADPNTSVEIAPTHIWKNGFNAFSHTKPSLVDFRAALVVFDSPIFRGHGGSVP